MIRRIRLEIVINDEGVVSASCCETIAPLRGFWKRWSANRHPSTPCRRAITQTTLLAWLRDTLRQPLKDNYV